MIAYFDTSAIVQLVVTEPASAACERIWNEATRVVSVRLWHAEARAALAQAHRLGRLDNTRHDQSVTALETMIDQIDHVEISPQLVRSAGDLAQTEALRGYDAVHLAAAASIAASDIVVVTGDIALASAVTRHGLAVATTT